MTQKQNLKVKGTMVVDVVKAIKADKSRNWNNRQRGFSRFYRNGGRSAPRSKNA
ncbi:MAG: hypothetical protein ABIK15_08175 [Pseudomonadota bacterium]